MNATIRCLLAVAIVLAARSAAAQWPGTLGIFDDQAMTVTHGTMEGTSKEVYLGIRLDPPGDGFTGIECSIAGLEQFLYYAADWQNGPGVVVGSLAAPVDTIAGTGGINVAWPTCQMGERVVMRLLLVAAAPPQDAVLEVRRRYPPSSNQFTYPYATTCDQPCFGCHWKLRGGTYTLNPTIGVDASSWSAIKSLYRRP